METIVTKSYQGAQTRLLLPKVKDVAGVIGDNNSTRLCFKLPKTYQTGWVKFIEFDCFVEREFGEIKPTYTLDENDSFLIPYEITEANVGKEVDYNLKFVTTDGEITEKSEMGTLYFRDSSNGEFTEIEPQVDVLTYLYNHAHCEVTYKDGSTEGDDSLPVLTFTPMDPDGEVDEVELNVPYLQNGIIPNRFIDKEIVLEVFKISTPDALTDLTEAQVPDMALVSEASSDEPYYMNLYMLVENDYSDADNWYLIHTDNPTFNNVNVLQNVDIRGTLGVGGDAEFESDIEVTGNTQSGSIVSESSIETQTLDVKTTSEFEGQVTFDDNIIQDTSKTATLGSTTTQDIHATTLNTSGKATLNSLEVEGQSQFDGNVTIGTHSIGSPDTHATLTVNGDVHIDSDKKIFVDTIQSQTDINPVTINDQTIIGASGNGNAKSLHVYGTTTSTDKITGNNGLDITNGATNLQDTNVGSQGTGNEKNLHVYGDTTLDGAVEANNNLAVNGTLTVTGQSTLAAVDAGQTTVDSFHSEGTAQIDGNTTIGRNDPEHPEYKANLTVNGDLIVSTLHDNRVIISSTTGQIIESSNITVTELDTLDNIRSNIQEQLDGKAPNNHADSTDKYGIGDETKYGHVKVDTSVSASSNNPVRNSAVKSYVDDAIATATANFLGTYNAVTDLGNPQVLVDTWTKEPDNNTKALVASQITPALPQGVTPSKNDYVFVSVNKSATLSEDWFWRFKYNGTTWLYEFYLLNPSFTQSQWDTINSLVSNSGSTGIDVQTIINHIADGIIHVTQTDKDNWNNKVDKLTTSPAGTYTKVTVNAQGQVTSGTTLVESDIPQLPISKITDLQTELDDKLDDDQLVTSFQQTPDNTHIPSEKLVKDSLDAKVTGPSTATGDNVALFDGATGKLIKDSGKTLGASIPAPTVTDKDKALIVNPTGTGFTFGEAGKVDDVQINGTTIVANKIANIHTGDGLTTDANVISHDTSGVTAGTYQEVTVDQLGHVTHGKQLFTFTHIYLEEVD